MDALAETFELIRNVTLCRGWNLDMLSLLSHHQTLPKWFFAALPLQIPLVYKLPNFPSLNNPKAVLENILVIYI